MKNISQIKHLGKNSIIFGLGYFIPLIVNVLLLPIYVRYLSQEEYGALSLLIAFGAILAIVMNLSVNRSVERFYVEYKDVERKQFLGSSMLFVIIYSAIIGLFLTLSANKLSFIIFKQYIPSYVYCFKLLVWITFFLMFSQFLSSLYVIKEKSTSYALLRITNFVILVTSVLYFLIVLKRGLPGILEGMVISSAIMSLVYSAFILPDISLKFNFSYVKKFLHYSLPLVPYRLFIILIAYIDRFYINSYLSLDDVGLYSVGVRLSMAMEVLVSSFAIAWIPFYYNRVKNEDSSAIFGRLVTLWAAVLVFVGLCVSLFSKELVTIFTTKAYYSAHTIMPVFVVGYLFLGFFNIQLAALLYSKKTKVMPLVSGLACIINFGFLAWLTPRFGILGPALSKTVAYFAMWVFAYVVSIPLVKIAYEHLKLIKVLVGGLSIFLLATRFSFSSIVAGIAFKTFLLVMYVVLLKYFNVVNVLNAKLLFVKEKTKEAVSSVEESLPEQ